jgi:ActR/RegA family two-component response regulator
MQGQQDFDDMLSQYEKKFPFKVVYLDDDTPSAERVKGLFDDQPIDFMIAPSPEEADEILQRFEPDLVITDLRLGEQSTTGEAWIVNNINRLRNSKKILLTGFATEIQNRPRLREAGVDIISKGEPEEDQLWDKMRHAPREKAARLIKEAAAEIIDSHRTIGPGRLESLLTSPIKRLFLKWAAGFEDQKSEIIYFGPRAYSIKDLTSEVEQGTEVGTTMMEMFVEDLEDLI